MPSISLMTILIFVSNALRRSNSTGQKTVAANSKFQSYPYCTASSIVGTLKRNPKNQSERTTRDEETINVAIPPLQKSLTEFSFAKNNHARWRENLGMRPGHNTYLKNKFDPSIQSDWHRIFLSVDWLMRSSLKLESVGGDCRQADCNRATKKLHKQRNHQSVI